MNSLLNFEDYLMGDDLFQMDIDQRSFRMYTSSVRTSRNWPLYQTAEYV